jgi:hypothetical protein
MMTINKIIINLKIIYKVRHNLWIINKINNYIKQINLKTNWN